MNIISGNNISKSNVKSIFTLKKINISVNENNEKEDINNEDYDNKEDNESDYNQEKDCRICYNIIIKRKIAEYAIIQNVQKKILYLKCVIVIIVYMLIV